MSYHLPIEDLRGQGYDGAVAMASPNVGAHGSILQAAPLAVILSTCIETVTV